MKFIPCAMCAFLFTALVTPQEAKPQAFQNLHNRMKEGVVLIQTLGQGRTESTGTGFLVDPKGIVLTNNHVIVGSSAVFATFPGDNATPIPCSLIDRSESLDLAALQLDRNFPRGTPVFKLTENDVAPLTDVLIIGHPRRLNWTVHSGKVAGIRTKSDLTNNQRDRTVEVIQLDVSAASGMSGAPVLLQNGQTTGVFFAGIDQGRLGLNFCVHAKHLRKLNLTRPATPIGRNAPVLSSTFNNSRIDYLADRSLPRVAPGTAAFRMNSQHWGLVPNDADKVLKEYIEDKGRFTRLMRREYVDQMLKVKNVTHVTNPNFCYSVLVPDGYSIVERITPTGVFVSSFIRKGSIGSVDITAYPIPTPPQTAQEQEQALITYATHFAVGKVRALQIGLVNPQNPFAVQLGPFSEARPRVSQENGSMRFWRHYANHPRFNESVVVLYAVYKDVFYTVDMKFPTSVPVRPPYPARFVEDLFIASSFSFVER